MIIKKFTAKTEAEAIENAKKELGNGLVVMNVKSVKPQGLFASLRPRLFEVTVALEEETEKFSAIKKEITKPIVKTAEETKAIEEKLDTLQNLLVTQMNASKEENQVAKKEAETNKDSKEDENTESEELKESDQVKFMKLLYTTMVDNEVDEKYANEIMGEIDKLYKPNMPMDYLLANIYQRMILKFGKAEEVKEAANGPKVVQFIGPTGVGKTTTIAKIAGDFVVNRKKKVAMLTTDTYRIAAAEQLRTYANILQVPFRVIYTEEELVEAVKEYYNYDFIFVDTMGHSHQNEEQFEKMKNFIGVTKDLVETQNYLVLSATTKYRDLLKIADSYSKIAEYQLIFTKLDETFSLGNLLNLKLHTGASIAYVTCGQNVPDDIEVFNPQKTVKQLLGGKKQ